MFLKFEGTFYFLGINIYFDFNNNKHSIYKAPICSLRG